MNKGKYRVLIVLSMAAFVMVIDSTAMNVSIAYLVEDLDSSVGNIQQIMSLYTLTMAALMLPGAKLADIFGAKRLFFLGACTYGVGTLVAALAVNTTMLMIGWSFIEGVAAAFMMPTALSLISSTYQGRERSVAMAVYTAVGSVGVAVGPIFGGIITTYLSWRVVFGLEVLIIVAILLNSKILMAIDAHKGDRMVRYDLSGTLISVVALLLIIYGGLQAQSDLLVAVSMMVGGSLLLGLLLRFLKWKKSKGKAILVDVAIFSSKTYNVVLLINLSLQICMSGVMFIISIYLQNVLQYDALRTGLTLMPLSATILLAALAVTKLADKVPQRFIVGFGCLTIAFGALLLYVYGQKPALISGGMMLPALAAIGLGIGCSMSLTGNIGLGALDNKYSNQAAGALTTINNLGASLGTAIIGSLFLFQIKPQIVKNLIDSFPAQLGQYTVDEASVILEQAFQKVQVMDPGLTSLSTDEMELLKGAVISGVNTALSYMLIVVIVLSMTSAACAVGMMAQKKELASFEKE